MANEMAVSGGAQGGGSNVGKMVKSGLILGIAGSTYVIASNQYVDGMFQDSAGMDTSRSAPLYRALVQFIVGLVLARVAWKYSKEAAIGFLAGGALQAMVRVMDDANIAPRIRDLVDGDAGNGTPRVTRPWVAPTTTSTTTSTTTAAHGLRGANGLNQLEGWRKHDGAPLNQMLRNQQ